MYELKNIKEHLHEKIEEKVLHKDSNMYLTATTMPREALLQIEETNNINLFDIKYKTDDERLSAKGLIKFKYGIKEFKGHDDLATDYFKNPKFGKSNLDVLSKIDELNPSKDERIQNNIVVISFNQSEVKILEFLIQQNQMVELCKYLSNEENIIKAVSFCQDFIESIQLIQKVQQSYENLSFLQASLLITKQILLSKGYTLPDELIDSVKSEELQYENDLFQNEEREERRGLTLEEVQKYQMGKR